MPGGEERGRDQAADGGVPTRADADRQGERTAEADDGTAEVRRLRERVRELEQRNERLESAIAAFDHDFRGALTVASNHLEMGRDDLPEPHFDPMKHAHDRMQAMVEELREVADGNGGGARRPVPLADLAEECWAGVDAPGSELVVETDALAVADRTRLLRLLENLFRNAVEYGSTGPPSHAREDAVEHSSTCPPSRAQEDAVEHSSTGGRRSGAERAAAGTAGRRSRRGTADVTVTVGALEDGFYVADDGPGIPAAERERVFEEGYTTGDGGSGLGLAIVRRVAAEHGWAVDVAESEAGGARFEVSGVELRSDR